MQSHLFEEEWKLDTRKRYHTMYSEKSGMHITS